LLPQQNPSKDRKTNFTLIIYSHGSTNPEKLAKIGPVDFEIIGLTEIVKTKQHIAYCLPSLLLLSGRRANNKFLRIRCWLLSDFRQDRTLISIDVKHFYVLKNLCYFFTF